MPCKYANESFQRYEVTQAVIPAYRYLTTSPSLNLDSSQNISLNIRFIQPSQLSTMPTLLN
jgi:hypothetical protein